MYTFVMFPFMLFFPVLSYKYFMEYLGNRSLHCECSFVLESEMKTWKYFVVKFNYLENKSQTYKFLDVVNKFVNKYDLEYDNDVYINATHITLRIPNTDMHSFKTVIDVLNSTDICLMNPSIENMVGMSCFDDSEHESSYEESEEESEEESDEKQNEKKDKQSELMNILDKIVGNTIDDSTISSCEKVMKSMLSNGVLNNIINEIIDMEDIQEDATEQTVIKEVTQEEKQEVTQEEKQEETPDDFEIIRKV